jgi:hypothetical protein
MEILTHYELANFERVKPPKISRSNFSLAFSILPTEGKKAINTIYSFFSYIDNIVDDNDLRPDSIAKKTKGYGSGRKLSMSCTKIDCQAQFVPTCIM